MTQNLRMRRAPRAENSREHNPAPGGSRDASRYGVVVHGLGKRYGDRWVVDDVSFTVEAGSFLSIVGPSGCGKSTSLRLIAGLDRPDSGEVWIGGVSVSSQRAGVSVSAARRGIGFVFQSYALWPHLTVFEHVAYPLRSERLGSGELRARVEETLEIVGLREYRVHYPSELSGGQQQRVALARAVVHRPAVLLLDEPLSNLDAGLRARVGVELRSLQKELGITAIYVTHDRVEALSLSDQIMVMHDGKAVEIGSPIEVYEHPTDLFSARFVSGANTMDGSVLSVEPSGKARIQLADTGAILDVDPHSRGLRLSGNEQVVVAARPEAIELSAGHLSTGPNLVHGQVLSVTYFGAYCDIVVKCGDSSVSVRSNPMAPGSYPEISQPVTLLLPSASLIALPVG